MSRPDGWTALHFAARNGLRDLHRYPEKNYIEGYMDVLDFLIENGAKIETRAQSGKTPLHIAAVYGNLKAVQCLLQHGARRDATDNEGMSALELARAYKREEVVGWLESS